MYYFILNNYILIHRLFLGGCFMHSNHQFRIRIENWRNFWPLNNRSTWLRS